MLKDFNLCKILKPYVGKYFYCTAFGKVRLEAVGNVLTIRLVGLDDFDDDDEKIKYISFDGSYLRLGVCILYPTEELYLKYPLDPFIAWMTWLQEETFVSEINESVQEYIQSELGDLTTSEKLKDIKKHIFEGMKISEKYKKDEIDLYLKIYS